MYTMRALICWFLPLLVMLGIVPGCTDPHSLQNREDSVTETDWSTSSDTSEAEVSELPHNDDGGCEMTPEDAAEIDRFYELEADGREYEDQDDERRVMFTTPYYQLPFMGGEWYRTEDRPDSHVAWDFNKHGTSGNQDCNEPIVAVASGRVITAVAGSNVGYGRYIRVRNDNDQVDVIYAHLNQLFVRDNQWVEQGQVIGLMGDTGNSSSCHLHLEMRRSYNGAKVRRNEMYFVVEGAYRGALWESVPGKLAVFGSRNQGKFDSLRNQMGSHNIGNQETHNVTHVHSLGWSLTYREGKWGDVTMYYEVYGCEGGHYCPRYNNTNSAWLVRHAIRAKYFVMGGPNSWLGFPTGNEYTWSNGQRQNFRCGYLYWNRYTGVTSEHYYGCP